MVIGIIAAVFFGIRIAEDVQPPVRIAALAAIATGVTLLGMWLERRVTAFGRLVSAGGLSLYYFTAFAAYALEPTKVIPDEAHRAMQEARSTHGAALGGRASTHVRVGGPFRSNHAFGGTAIQETPIGTDR